MGALEEFVVRLDDPDPTVASEARHLLWTAIYVSSRAETLPARDTIADELTKELAATVEPKGPVPTNVPDSVTLAPVPKYSAASRRFLCQLLARIAGDEQIPTLLALFDDLEIRDSVRSVLEMIGTQRATTALIKGLAKASPEFRIGILNALGRQGWADAAAALALATQDADPEVRLAALEGLANFPDAANDKLFVAATQTGTPRERMRAQRARLRLAETLYLAGENGLADAICQAIAADPSAGPCGRAAHR
jgi:HEAT repeat protein